jgi:RNA 3'-terminal phosphate cyclase (ATP)
MNTSLVTSREMITIDGSRGEGGGQVLRTSLGLSLATGRPFRIEGIRAGRQKPGLLRQHLTAVRAAEEIGRAEVTGAELGSRELTFRPGEVRPGAYEFAIGTAGSATLVLQAILPALLTASAPSEITISGGTHNTAAPPFDFLARAFAPLVSRMGPRLELELVRPGFFPAGGGEVRARVVPAARLEPIEVEERGKTVSRLARAIVSNLPFSIAEREATVLQRRLGWLPEEIAAESVKAHGPGNVVMVEIASEHVADLFTSFGERGLPAETVAERAAKAARRYLERGAPVGEHLADQLLVPLALAGGGSFVTCELSSHATTNMEVISRFLDVTFEVEPAGDRIVRVLVR